MSALLYAIAGCRPEAVPAVTAGGQRLRAVGERPPVAILAADAGPEATGAEALWAHEQAVAELMDAHTLLPARYGTRLSESEAAELVRERRHGLLAALERVRGAVELAVTVAVETGAGSPPAGGGPGTAYLQGRLAEQRAVDRARGWLEALHELARAEAGGRVTGGRLRCAYLVGRDRLTAFLACAEALDAAHPELALVCTGPWPPYSFSGGWR
jgi:hypothetical protein